MKPLEFKPWLLQVWRRQVTSFSGACFFWNDTLQNFKLISSAKPTHKPELHDGDNSYWALLLSAHGSQSRGEVTGILWTKRGTHGRIWKTVESRNFIERRNVEKYILGCPLSSVSSSRYVGLLIDRFGLIMDSTCGRLNKINAKQPYARRSFFPYADY